MTPSRDHMLSADRDRPPQTDELIAGRQRAADRPIDGLSPDSRPADPAAEGDAVAGEVTGTISVFLVDDHEMVRRGIEQLINSQPDMALTGWAARHRGAAEAIVRAGPDVAILDISLGDGSGLDICRSITEHPADIACLMLTSVIDDRAMIAAHDAGAAGFCLKSLDGLALLDSIRRVASGARLLDDAEVRVARRRLVDFGDGQIDALTSQERQIFDLVGRGYSNRQIGNELFLAEKTVKNYVSNVLSRLGLSRRTEIAAMASRLAEREDSWRP